MVSLKKIKLLVVSLISFLLLKGQQNALPLIAGQFEYNQQNILEEKIFAHTDKKFYLAGEIIWFKLYYVDGNDHLPLDISKVAYVEIIDKEQRPVLQTKIELSQGEGTGSLYIPVSINSGFYKLRAYTSWMKNFDAEFYFEKKLTIVNSLKSPNETLPGAANYDIQFFPEGGDLVQGIESKVAFRITNSNGSGIDFKGAIVDKNNDTISVFQPLKMGIGNFTFTPQSGNNYKAFITLPDTILIKELPAAYEQGYAINVTSSASQFQIKVKSNIRSANTVYLFAHTGQKVKVKEQSYLKDGSAEFTIDKNKLGEGISHLTIYNSENKPVCERLVFIKPVQKLVIEPAAPQLQFANRKKVTLTINSADQTGTPIPANMSLSVYRFDSLQDISGDNIDNYIWLTSDLKGNIESPDYYFSNDAHVTEATDNLMLTHGWSRFIWRDVLQNTKPTFSFLPEWRGHIISGKASDIKTGSPAVNVQTYLSVPGNRIQLYGSESDSAGNIRFYTNKFIGANEIVVQTDNRYNTTYKLEITSPFSGKFSSKHLPVFNLNDYVKNPLVDNNVEVQVQNGFNGEKLKQFYIPEIDSNAFYGPPDKKYNLDDYTRFSTMEEVLREYIFEVQVRRQKDNFRLIMADGANKVFMDDPFTLFNGVPVFDPNKIIRYDPLKVKRIEVVKRKYFYGPLVLNGIANFITYHPDPSMISDAHSLVLDYEGLQYQREFFSPMYDTPEQISSRLPDFRNVLYWSPNVITDKNGKTQVSFYTSDRKGRYAVVMQGMSTDGKFGEKTVAFEVK